MKRLLIYFILINAFSCQGLFFEEPEQDELSVLDAFYTEISQHYSFFNVISFEGFQAAYENQRSILANSPSINQLNSSLQVLVDFLEDGHTNVYGSSNISYFDYFENFPNNMLESNSSYFSSYQPVNSALAFGVIRDEDIGYIRILTFSGGSDFGPVDEILENLKDSKAIIIDVRSNGGGDSRNADIVISRFNDQSRLQFRQRRRIGRIDEFSRWFDNYTETNSDFTYLKPTYVLTNRSCFSSTEWFVAGMMTIPHVTIVGDTTGGGSGNPLFKELPNGWQMRTSNTQKQLPSGNDYQFIGLYPDIPVWISAEDEAENRDTILETAIELANQ